MDQGCETIVPINRDRFNGEKMCGNDSKEYINLGNCVFWNRDVKALYRSIEIDIAVKKCAEMIVKKKSTNLRCCVIRSMDVKALYPSINIDSAVERCVEMTVKKKSTSVTV